VPTNIGDSRTTFTLSAQEGRRAADLPTAKGSLPMNLDQTIFGDIIVLKVNDTRLDARSGAELKVAVTELVAKGQRRIVLDLTSVKTVDSTGLGAIVSSLKVIGRQGELVLSGLADTVTTLFRLTRMDKVFRTFGTPMEAVASLYSFPAVAGS
jgi:anti-sigma B factor antagonist